LYPGSADFHIW